MNNNSNKADSSIRVINLDSNNTPDVKEQKGEREVRAKADRISSVQCQTAKKDSKVTVLQALMLRLNRLSAPPKIVDVKYNGPATIVWWADGTKTIVKCLESDTFSQEVGLAMAISKKALGNKGSYNEVFKKWVTYDD